MACANKKYMALASDIVCMIDKIFKWLRPYAAHEVTIELGEIQSYSGKQQTYGKLYFRKKIKAQLYTSM